MSNSEERLLILRMLEEGKITSEEAARLLEAIDGTSGKTQTDNTAKQTKQPNFFDEIDKTRQKLNEWKKDFNKKYNQKDFDRMVDEFSIKAEKLGKNVAATAVGIVDKIADLVGSFVDTSAFNIFGNYTVIERFFEVAAVEGTELDIEGINGHMLIKKHLDDKVVIKTKVRSPQNNADEILIFNQNESSISLKLNKSGNISVSHEVFLPALKFSAVRFNTINGKIYVEDCLSDILECVTKNAPIDLMGVTSDSISVNTKNAKVQAGYIIGRDIKINTSNSVVDVKNIKANNFAAITSNGRILIENAQNYNDFSEINLFLKTTNGGIKVNMNDMDNRGYKVKAQTSDGIVNLLIPELIYHNINKKVTNGSFVEAESNGYNNYSEKVYVNAETVNGDIEIVK